MMTYTFKMNDRQVSIRACDMHHARILAMAKYGREWYHSRLIGASNSI